MDYLDQCDLVFSAPDPAGSMLLGNGDITLRARVESDGDLLLNIRKSDAWDENARLADLGQIRISLDPNPFRAGTSFRQRLHLIHGEISIAAGAITDLIQIRLWVDANQPVIRIQIESQKQIGIRASIASSQTSSSPADAVLPPEQNRLAWCHRNTTSIWPSTMQLQSTHDWAAGDIDPLLYRTFGAAIEADVLTPTDLTTLRSLTPQTRCTISIHPLTLRAVDLPDWTKSLHQQVDQTNKRSIALSRSEHESWWQSFWERSIILITGDAAAQAVTRGYALQRFANACAGRGTYPIQTPGAHRTEAGYSFESTRLFYWPMLAAGDFDLLQPLFRMYLDALPMALHRTRTWFSHAGAFFPETMHFWGSYLNSDYGADRAGRAPGEVHSRELRHYFSSSLELLCLLLDHELFVFTEAFAKSTLLPLADAIVTFYDRHYPRMNGKLRFEPAQSLRTWHEAVDPLPEIAGLKKVLDGLLRLPEEIATPDRRSEWQRIASQLPPLPMRRGNETLGANYLIPAIQYNDLQDTQNPELSAIFPYRLLGIGKPDLPIALRTFERRRFKSIDTDAIHAALLGLADQAKAIVTKQFSASNPTSQSDTPNCAAMLALQFMLLQCDGQRLLILPAWPKTWSVHWKLHAPMRTIVEGIVRDGELRKLTITPEVREKDAVLAR